MGDGVAPRFPLASEFDSSASSSVTQRRRSSVHPSLRNFDANEHESFKALGLLSTSPTSTDASAANYIPATTASSPQVHEDDQSGKTAETTREGHILDAPFVDLDKVNNIINREAVHAEQAALAFDPCNKCVPSADKKPSPSKQIIVDGGPLRAEIE